jgi:hypothetical protein
MKINRSLIGWSKRCGLALVVAVGIRSVNGQGTGFGYQGRLLNTNGQPATGIYDFRFTVFDSTNIPGVIIAGPLSFNAMGVTNGLFAAALDFGPGVFTGPPRWLEMSVRTNGGTFTNMSPREPLLAAPYAILAGTASNVVSGLVVKSLNGLKDNIILAPGTNVTMTTNGNLLTLSATGAGGSGIWSVLNNNAYYNAGNVGIGTTAPTAALDVRGSLTLETGGSATLYTGTGATELNRYLNIINSPSSASASGLKAGGILVSDTYAYANPGKNDLVVKGGAGIGTGSWDSQTKFTVRTTVNNNLPFPFYGFEHTDGTIRLSTILDANGASLGTRSNHPLNFFVNDGSPTMTINTSGNVSVCTLTIRGGCDLAEPFPITEEQTDKGSVMVIDADHPGQLKLSRHAYDARVAGIVSGANGVNPGISLHQEGVMEAGDNVALSGRVYVLADAAYGAVNPGDLLTTSDTPGHAMKVSDHARAQGAILGKAMSSLSEGKGTVLVLVTLQ